MNSKILFWIFSLLLVCHYNACAQDVHILCFEAFAELPKQPKRIVASKSKCSHRDMHLLLWVFAGFGSQVLASVTPNTEKFWENACCSCHVSALERSQTFWVSTAKEKKKQNAVDKEFKKKQCEDLGASVIVSLLTKFPKKVFLSLEEA